MKTSPEDHDHASQCDIGLENSIAWVSCQTFPARGSWQMVLGKHAGDVKPDLHEVLADARACKFPGNRLPRDKGPRRPLQRDGWRAVCGSLPAPHALPGKGDQR